MKVSISVPPPLFKEADRLARKLRKSRSRLYCEALAAYAQKYRDEAVRKQLDVVYARPLNVNEKW